ncbi:unnamed protein product [Aureobasidium mustum]|uniref:Apple domain-containing protein n=1 Tax=Aureobasidium mustum TaxID=2773714 RepID=A0A9N8PJT1_9PEZI|nr:unnamed protein product [Aureobasidium mustum]
MAAKFAVSLMALLGAVSAQSSSYTNSSSIATTTSSTSPSASATTVAGVTYLCKWTQRNYSDVTPLTLSRKRQANSGIDSCLNTCSDNVQCVGTSFSDDTGTCEYYSQINEDSETSSPGTDFALVQSRPDASSTANSTTSATGSATRPGASVGSNSTTSATGSATRSVSITGGAGNSTSSRTSSSASRTSSATSVPSSPSTLLTFNGVVFLLEIDRAAENLDDCLQTCSANSQCAGTSFTDGTCTFYSSITEGSRQPTEGTDFATVISRPGQVGAGNGNTNGTSGAGNTTSPVPSNSTAESFICPTLDGSVLLSNLEITFTVSCGQFLIGTTYDALAEINTKRQTIDNGLPSTLSNCVDLCSLAESCVGTTFEIATEQCTFYSAVSYATPLDGFDSAVKAAGQDGNGNGAGEGVTTTTVIAGVTQTVTVPAGTTTQYVGAASTATVYVTSVITVTQNAGPTGYPSGATVTEIVPVSTMTYVPIQTITLPQNYAQPTVTVTVGGGAAAPVQTQMVTVTVDQNGNVIGSSTADAVAGAAGQGQIYPTVTVHDLYCPTSTAPSVVWTTVFVR